MLLGERLASLAVRMPGDPATCDIADWTPLLSKAEKDNLEKYQSRQFVWHSVTVAFLNINIHIYIYICIAIASFVCRFFC